MLICDLDGTAFNNIHRAHLVPEDITQTKNWEAFSLACVDDSPVLPVINLVKHLAKMHDNKITFVTSRVESAKHETSKQLFEYFSEHEVSLHMRPMNDNRSPVDFKRAVFSELLAQANDYSLVIDDHAGIIKMVSIQFPHVNRLLVESFDCTVLKPKEAAHKKEQPTNLVPYQKIEIAEEELKIIKIKEDQEQQIANAFGVPKRLLFGRQSRKKQGE